MRFAEFMKQTFFDPLGMSNTFVRDERRLPIPHQANAYDKARNGFKDVTTSRLDSIYGDGNAFSTVCDLAKWLQTILDILLDDRAPVTGNARIRLSNIIVPIDALKRAFSQVVLNNQSGVTYGFGWTVFLRADLINGGDSTLEVVFHTGVWNGVRTFIGIIPNRGQGVIGILLSNFGKFEACEEAGKIAHLYLRDVPGIKRFVDCRGLH
jgi:CubicO group peptidase (beta-lactamase class C family)